MDGMVPAGAAMRAVQQMIERVAGSDATVLILGESGVGKALVARALHDGSPRRRGPFVKVNCAALPFALLESELFGHERGAFTGADRPRAGRFELARGGTILLDEIGEMPLALQAKLLQVLQDREFTRLGGQRDVRVDARVVAATNRSLTAMVEQGDFRADLYYRLNVIGIRVPPLRERVEEIPRLIEHFLAAHSREYARPPRALSESTRRRLLGHAWPGNVRELENLVRRIVLLEDEEWALERLTPVHPPAGPRRPSVRNGPPAVAAPTATPGLKQIARRAAAVAEWSAIGAVLARVDGNRAAAARALGVSYKTLLSRLKRAGPGA